MSGIKIGGKTLTPINVAPIKIGSKTLSPVNSIKIGNKTLTPISEANADGPSDTQRFFRQMGSKLAPALDTAEAISDKALAGAGLVSQKAGELGLRALGAGADALGFNNAGKSLKDTADELGQTFSQSAEAVGQTGGAGTTRIIGRGLKNFVTGQAAANQKLARGINNVLADTADFYGADRARDFFRENSNLASLAINKIENFGDNDMKDWQAAGEIADATALAPAMLGHSAKAARLAKALGASQKVATRIGNAVGSAANGAIMGGFTGGARAYGQEKPDLKQAGLESTIWGGANAILGGLSRAPILAKGMRKLEEARVAAQELKPAPAKAAQDIQSATPAGQTAGEGFTMRDGAQKYPYNAFVDIENDLAGELKLPSSQIRASLQYLYNLHPEMFKNKGDVYRTIKGLISTHDYAGDSLRNPSAAYLASRDGERMSDMAIGRDSGGVIHLNKDKRISNADKKIFETAAAEASNSQHKQQVLGAQMNTGKEHFSPTDNTIIPQNSVAEGILNNPNLFGLDENVIKAIRSELEEAAGIAPKKMSEAAKGADKAEAAAQAPNPFLDEILRATNPANNNAYLDQILAITNPKAVIAAKKGSPTTQTITSTLNGSDEAAKKGLNPNSSLYSNDKYIEGSGTNSAITSTSDIFDGGVGSTTHITTTPANDEIISLSSDKNLNAPAEFKNSAGGGIDPAAVVRNIAERGDLALRLEPKADVLSLVRDFQAPIKTPIFEAKIAIDKMLNHLADKAGSERRLEYVNLIKPTLENPLFIAKDGERYRFFKTFIDDRDKTLKFLSVIENDRGEFLGVTATPLKNTDLKNLIKKGNIVWGGDTLSSLSTPQAMRNQGLDTATDIIPQNGENMIKGFSSSAIPANIASAGAGAATGAALDDKNRARGAFIGALGGLGLVNAPSLVSKLKGGAKVGEIAQDIEAAAKDKPSILSNMRSYLKAVGANSISELKDLSGKDIGLSYARQMASEHINKEFKNIAYEILSGSQSLAQNLKNGAINAARFARRALSETKGADYLLRNDELFSAKSAYSAKMENLQSALSGLDDADRVAMHEYMVGEGNAIKPELKPLADALRRQIDDMSAKLVDLGVLDKASRDALAGQYLARSYEKHLKDRINSVFSSGKKVDEIHSRGFAFKEFKDREAMDKFLSKNPQIAKSMDQAYNKGGVRVVEKPNGKIELWRDYTKDERSAMGEIRDAAFSIPQTLNKLNDMIENAKFLKSVSELSGGAVIPNTEIKARYGKLDLDDAIKKELGREGYAQMPKSDSYGALAGQWVRKDIKSDIISSFAQSGDMGVLIDGWKKYLSIWKMSKTVWSQTAHVGNYVSNGFLLNLAGMSAKQVVASMAKFTRAQIGNGAINRYKQLRLKNVVSKLSPAERREYAQLMREKEIQTYKLAEDEGLFGRSSLLDIQNGFARTTKELRQGKIARIIDGDAASKQSVVASTAQKAGDALGAVADKAGALYAGEDNVGRLALFSHYIDKGLDPKSAKIATNSWIPDYSRQMPAGMRALRDSGIAPFISWSYYVMPAMGRYLARHPVDGAKKILPMLAALGYWQYKVTGEANPYSDKIPDDIKGRSVAVWRDGDRVRTIKMDRYLPYMNLTAPANYAKGLASGPTTQGAYALFSMMADGKPRMLYNNRPITKDTKPIPAQAYDYLNWLLQGFTPMPGGVSSGINLVSDLSRDETSRKRNNVMLPKTKAQSVAKFLGFNSADYSVSGQMKDAAKKKLKKKD
ncbi:PBECR2 nuclease fold domain-containing protein [uncultured Campylobacter sp.]|uniref:PBECR2 nuclease fold domain-containing protein n=1 Tax=uncultured Campylobacter sp. TaxID=218934 RepID=UPI0026359418|nr:PBECR2 nuclease fold domain-containing protein [uncultured Campylobacter sp.]